VSADRDVTEIVIAGWIGLLRQNGVRHPERVARAQIGIAKSHGVRFARPAHMHDPGADLRAPRERGDQQAGVLAALSAIGKGICPACGDRVHLAGDLIGPHDVSDNPPHPPFHPCPGAGERPRTRPDGSEDQEHNDE
jgi:hypothetical protein